MTTKSNIALAELVEKGADADLLRGRQRRSARLIRYRRSPNHRTQRHTAEPTN